MNVTTTMGAPSAFVTKNRQRVKQYNDSVYLKNGDEFEIELFNPTTNKVLAKIEVNGKSLGSGLILRPGERVFLERYLDVAKKFLFETYKVNGANNEVVKAIVNNGRVSVQFFDEFVQYSGSYGFDTYNSNLSFGYCGTGGNAGYSTGITQASCNPTTFTTSANFFNSTSLSKEELSKPRSFFNEKKQLKARVSMNSPETKIIETGRIEKGSNSNQTFKYDDAKFYSFASWVSNWQILPLSERPITKDDFVLHCTNCGTKRKKESHKFCPLCGNKY